MIESPVQNMDIDKSSLTEESSSAERRSTSSSDSKNNGRGLSLSLASVFIVGEMAGSGVLALPQAIANAGWSGIAMLIICCINTLYAGICLGKCWTILEERYDEYKVKNRYPYAAIAYVAVGQKMRYLVSFCNDFTLFGVSTVFLLLASQLIASLAEKWGISFCYWILILAVILCPLMYLGTPEDFWPAAILALVTTCIACILLFVALIKADNEPDPVEYPTPTVTNFFLAFGTILFAFGGASSFPTFQNDMKDKTQFPAAATIGFGTLMLLYFPVSVLGYVIYGGGSDAKNNTYLKDNIIDSLPSSSLKTATEILLAIHLLFAFLIVINAPAQEFEEFFKVPKRFGWKRVVLRTGIMVLVVFVAQSLPRFGKILNLVGGSTVTLTNSIFPCLFYLKLCARSSENPQWPQRNISRPEKIYLYVIMILGIIGGIISSYAAINAIVEPQSFNPPCYESSNEKRGSTSSSDAKSNERGLSLSLASVFIVGEMAGSGVLALPQAIGNAGWSGIAMLIICCINTLYAGICLGKCWTILEERYDEYKVKNRYPYAAIAYVAVGQKMRYFVSFCNDFTMFGVSTVFLLLASQLIASLAEKWGISFCYWVLILAVILCPLMYLGTPEDFWPAAILALVTTCIACLLLFVALIKADNEPDPVEYPAPTVLNFFLAFGTILFAFGGASSFPTFQNDMKDRTQFPAAATIGFGTLLFLYLPVSVLGYVAYGGGMDAKNNTYLQQNVIDSLPSSSLKTATQILLAIHLFFAFLIVINAPAQEFEEFFKVPNRFGWKRVVLRTGIMVLIVFVAQSLPRFGKILNLVGGSTVTLTTSIFPCFFYLKLCARSSENPQWPQRNISRPEKIYLYVIMILGIVGGIISSYAAINSIVEPQSFNPPCYVNIDAANI